VFRLNDWATKNGPLRHAALHAGRIWRRVALLAVAVGVLLAVYWPAQAAMELLFFRAESTETAVLLSWATIREINVEGYIILCKRENEPESAYHQIGTRMAKGGPDQPAAYTFDVTQGVYYGEQYCFRLEEVTTDGLPGEKHDICGFGPGVTPTPVTAPLSATGTITPVIVTPPPDFTPPPTLITPVVPGFTEGTPTPVGQSPLETPTPEFMETDEFLDDSSTIAGTGKGGEMTPTQAFSPLETSTFTATLSAAQATETAAQAVSPLAVPPAAESEFAGDPSAMPTDVPTETPTATLTPALTDTPDAIAETATAAAAGSMPGAGEGGIGSSTEATPTQMYVVVTATPTPEAVAAAPALTPLPTATPTPDIGLLGVLTPTAQNMMIMLLCLIFLSATGLGTLGLVTAVLYFRSQAQRRVGADEFSSRRRF
jgi:hypothetical protein